MAFCPNCGAAVEGSFCGACGKPVGDTTPAGPVGGAAAGSAAGLQDNVAGALCYVLGLITGVLFLVLEPYNKNRNIRFHAFQSIFLHVGVIVIWIALTAIGVVMGSFLGLLLVPLHFIFGIGSLVLWILLLVKTFNGQKLVLPIIGPIAEKQAG
jgi:uncharacterized membrane protein